MVAVTSRENTLFLLVNHQILAKKSFGLFVFKISLSLALGSLEHGQDEFNKNAYFVIYLRHLKI